MSKTFVYSPTGETVDILMETNRGQYRPGDPGSGIRLYAVRFPNGTEGMAAPYELTVIENGKRRAFRPDSKVERADF